MSTQRLSILLVADDRVLLRHLSKFLLAFGYNVRQAADATLARAALDAGRADFLVMDQSLINRGGMDLCREISNDEQNPYIHTLMLAENSNLQELSELIQSGVDDILAKPVVYGELLARLRAGARSREFERRWREQSGIEPVTGLANRSTLIDQLERWADDQGSRRPTAACVVFDIDSFARVERQSGCASAQKVLRQVAALVSEHTKGGALPACLGRDRFSVIFPDITDAEAGEWANQFGRALADDCFMCGDDTVAITASFGVAAGVVGRPACDLIVTQAEEALAAAKSSGRDFVAQYGQFDDEAAAWAELATPGRLFEHTVARDVMTPCTVSLRVDDTGQRAAALLAQTQLFAVPVVDSQGRLAGVVTQETDWVRLSGSGREHLVSDALKSHPPTESEFTSFSALVDFFADDPSQFLVIVDDDRPTGMITRGNLASLSKPLTRESFRPESGKSSGSDYLLVGDESDCAVQ